MFEKKEEHPKEKPRSQHQSKRREWHDFRQLINPYPTLTPFAKLNLYNIESLKKYFSKCIVGLPYKSPPAEGHKVMLPY